MKDISLYLQKRIISLRDVLENDNFMLDLFKAGERLRDSTKKGKAILICGNGGSAAEAQHMSSEIVGRFQKERNGLPSIALTSDTAIITAVANDFGYDMVFARQVEAYKKTAGVLVLLSSSGNSINLLAAAKKARECGMYTIGLLGKDGGLLKDFCDIPLIVPSRETTIIQEIHLAMIHILCEMMEDDSVE